jgi:glycerate kinase
LNVLIIPDKFKGTLTATAAARAIARGWRRARRGDIVNLLPMSDGGDGFGEVMGQLLKARARKVETVDSAHQACKARWWWEPRTKTALIESAAVIGLAMLPPKKFHPFELDTFGLGKVLNAAIETGAQRCLIGIGGSATNDGGFGLARALGWRFFDRADNPIERWTQLERLASIQKPLRRRWFRELTVAVDVQNRLLGPRGASRVYGPQKGLLRDEIPRAEGCLRRLTRVVGHDLGNDFSEVPGAGAAGGLGFGLLAFADARLAPGFEIFAERAQLEAHLQWTQLVLTAEGAIDHSTLMGKGVGQVANKCRELGVGCIGLAGTVAPGLVLNKHFRKTYALVELTSLNQAKADPAFWLERLADRVARSL